MRKISAWLVMAAIATAGAVAAPGAARAAEARLDPGFGQKGIVRLQETRARGKLLAAQTVVETTDGDLVALSNGEGSSAILVRLNADGGLDQRFGDRGIARLNATFHDQRAGWGQDLAMTSGGRLLTTGINFPFIHTSSKRANCAVMARFLPRGDLDQSFARDGRKRQCLRTRGSRRRTGLEAGSIDVTGKGKILIAGRTDLAGSTGLPFVARFHPDGRLDETLRGGSATRSGQPGILTLGHGAGSFADLDEVRALRHGKILAVGQFHGETFVARLKRNGGFDPTFGRNGRARIRDALSGEARAAFGDDVTFDSKGRILVLGTERTEAGFRPFVARLDREGRLDRSFGAAGIARPALGSFQPSSITVQRDGRIVFGGERADVGRGFSLVRLRRDGDLDRGFFDAGVFTPKIPYLGNDPRDLVTDDRGRIVATGGRTSIMAVVRILPGG